MFSKPSTKHPLEQRENLALPADEASVYLCVLVERPEALMTLGSLFNAFIWIVLLLITDKRLIKVSVCFDLESTGLISIPPQQTTVTPIGLPM